MVAPGTRVGVLLAGCGTHDGSEIGEALLTFLELERQGARAVALVAEGPQMQVVNHATGEEMDGLTRDMAAEAARLTRGQVEMLGSTPPSRLHGLIIPGGSGVVKNLMSGTLQPGVPRRLLPPVASLLQHCLDSGKPVGLMSVANFLLSGMIESPVLPQNAGTGSDPIVVDESRRLVYAPAFLTARSLAEVAESVHALVDLVLHYADQARQMPSAGAATSGEDA